MNSKITGYPSNPVQVGTDKSVQRTRDTGVGAAAGGSGEAASTPVQITDRARQMAALESVLQGLPVIDEARVTAVRLAIEEGRYQVDAERIAEKLLRLEGDLAQH